MNDKNLVDCTKNDDPIPLIINISSVQNNSNAFSDHEMVKTLHSIQHDSPIPIVIECENVVNMDGFGTTKVSGVDHNFNSLDYSISDSQGSVDIRIDHSCPMKVHANVNDHTSCMVNHESKIKKDENPLERFRCALHERTLIDI